MNSPDLGQDGPSEFADLADIDIARGIDHAGRQAAANRSVALQYEQRAADPCLPADERAKLHARAEDGFREAEWLGGRAGRLSEEAERRGIPRCAMTADCPCPRCRDEGPIRTLVGDFSALTIVARELVIEAWVGDTARPRRGPIILHFVDDGALPKERKGRAQAVEVLNRFLAGVSSEGRRGRRPGGGLDAATVRREVDELRETGVTVESACEALAVRRSYSPETIRRTYYTGRNRR